MIVSRLSRDRFDGGMVRQTIALRREQERKRERESPFDGMNSSRPDGGYFESACKPKHCCVPVVWHGAHREEGRCVGLLGRELPRGLGEHRRGTRFRISRSSESFFWEGEVRELHHCPPIQASTGRARRREKTRRKIALNTLILLPQKISP